jgi:Sugar-binding cellulase-like
MITRKDFLKKSMLLTAAAAVVTPSSAIAKSINHDETKMKANIKVTPRAITMWDFSWIERRWDGAGYEIWDEALDGLLVRGYNAIRIDAFPHLIANGAEKERTLLPVWDQQVWGSADINRIRPFPALVNFIEKCRIRGIKVALSSWYREDSDNLRMTISSPEDMASIWIKTLSYIKDAGLLDNILWTDLCNEWPGDIWAPYFQPKVAWGEWHQPHSLAWMRKSIELVRKEFPDMPLLYSLDTDRVENYLDFDLSYFDLFEHHIWMAQQNGGEFNKAVGYSFGRFDPTGYRNLSLKAESVYRENPLYWQELLTKKIDRIVAVSAKLKKPLAITECWGLVDYKDWPLLKWDWIKELCEIGVKRSSASGQWATIATSNFCGPQFVGMWKDIEWHQKMTSVIKNASISSELVENKFVARLR